MIHKIIGWFQGYVVLRLYGDGIERFINLCRYHQILLWDIIWGEAEEKYGDKAKHRKAKKGNIKYGSTKQGRVKHRKEKYRKANICNECSCTMMLHDYRKIREIARKSGVWPVVTERIGGPFVCHTIRKRASFFVGITLFLCGLFFLSSRIWGIEIEGQSYHTKETIARYLNQKGIYEGMPAKKVQCTETEEWIRKDFPDIGWVSIEKSGSKLYVRIREVRLIAKKKKLPKADLVAERDGVVQSIVTRGGTAKVRAGDKVKKGQVLIRGIVNIMDDNGEVAKKKKVRAAGTVKIKSMLDYRDELPVTAKVRAYTGRKKYLHQIDLFGTSFFLHNPLNHLETYQKYDIIREGGQLCPSVSCRFPIRFWKKTYLEVKNKKKTFAFSERKRDLQARYSDYVRYLKEHGYHLIDAKKALAGIHMEKEGAKYVATGTIAVWKTQTKFVKRHAKRKRKHSSERKPGGKMNGSNGNAD